MKHSRKKKLVNSRLQLRLTAVFLAVACASILFQVVILNWSLLRFARELGVASNELLEGLPGLLLTNIGLTALVLVPTMLFIGIQVTHRIAGPIYRFELFLDGIVDGTETGDCHIRNTDELQDLCVKLNRAVNVLRARVPDESSPDAEDVAAEEDLAA